MPAEDGRPEERDEKDTQVAVAKPAHGQVMAQFMEGNDGDQQPEGAEPSVLRTHAKGGHEQDQRHGQDEQGSTSWIGSSANDPVPSGPRSPSLRGVLVLRRAAPPQPGAVRRAAPPQPGAVRSVRFRRGAHRPRTYQTWMAMLLIRGDETDESREQSSPFQSARTGTFILQGFGHWVKSAPIRCGSLDFQTFRTTSGRGPAPPGLSGLFKENPVPFSSNSRDTSREWASSWKHPATGPTCCRGSSYAARSASRT